MKEVYTMIEVSITGGEISEEEKQAYIERAVKQNPHRVLSSIGIHLDGEYVDLEYHFADMPFDRIRRITGYLVGTLDRFNNAKFAEVQDRVPHSTDPCEDIYVS